MSTEKHLMFVHAEEWHSIALIPAEQMDDIQRHLDAEEEMESHVAPRGISIEAMHAAFGGVLTEADKLLSGYTTDLEHVEDGFGFYDDDFGGIYGTLKSDIVQDMYFNNTFCDCGLDFSAVMGALEAFARAHDLVLVDWLMGAVVDLRRTGAMQAYFDDL